MAEIEEVDGKQRRVRNLDLALAIRSALTGYKAVIDSGIPKARLKPFPLKKIQTYPPPPHRPFDAAPLPSLHSS
jgi:hypothetical protein